ncbi:MAG: BatA domain-containing protein [Bacteroidota bacterium]
MSFANPAFLFALGLLAIPVIIHLFNFRKFRRVYFTNVALLEEVKEQTQSTSRLKNLLILLCRLLAVAALVLAFAEPFVPSPTNLTPQVSTVGIYIDNSPSMQSKGEEGILLSEAITKGRSIVEAYPENTAFILATNNSTGKLQRQLTKTEALDEIELIKASNASRDLSAALKKIQSVANGKPVRAFLVSDFQKSTAALPELFRSDAKNVSLVPVSGNASNNLAIDSLWFATPTHLLNGTEELSVQLVNYGTENADNVTIELMVNGKPGGIANASVPAGSTGTASISFVNRSSGINRCEVRVNDAPIIFDNNYYFAYKVNDKLRVIEIEGKQVNPAIANLFSSDADYLFTSFSEQNTDYNALKGSGALILNGIENISSGLGNAITAKLKSGESVAIFPGKNSDLSSYNALLSRTSGIQLTAADTSTVKVSGLESKHPFYRNIFDKIPANLDLPNSKKGFLTSKGSYGKAQTLLKLQNGSDFLSVTTVTGGKLFVFNTPLNLENGNFSQHGLFAPIILRIAESSGYLQQMSFVIGDSRPIEIKTESAPQENLFRMRPVNTSGHEIIPQVRKTADNILLYPPAQDINPGNFDILGGEQDIISAIGINLPREESDIRLYTIKQLDELCAKSNGSITLIDEKPEKITNEIRNHYHQQKLWKWFVLFTLIFLTLEIILTKWLR